MNVCHVITRLIVGGAQENTLLTCRGLIERGHRVSLIAGCETGSEGSLWEDAYATGCDLTRVDSLRRAVRPWQDVVACRTLRRLFERIQPDIVHTHSSKAGILGRRAAATARVPVIVHTIHGMSFNRTQSWFLFAFYRMIERWAARDTTAFVSVADSMTQQALAAGLGTAEQFTTIRSGIDTGRFAPNAALRAKVREEWALENDDIVVGTIARLFDNKGYEAILEAMPAAVAESPHLRFVWIGDGPNRKRYEARLARMGLRDRVRFAGLVHPRDVAALVNGFDIVLHASKWEGLPRALVQALVTEVPVVSFDIDGAREVVVPGETGLLVPFGDIGRLAEALVTLAGDPTLRVEMGRCGRSRCLEEFDRHRMVDKIEALYTDLTQATRPA